MRRIVALVIATIVLASCTSIDCPVDNVVATKYELRKADGSRDTLLYDTLTISTKRCDGNDSVLLNRKASATAFSLPISSGVAVDTLLLTLTDTLSNTTYNYIYVEKTDQPHFESVDCTMSYFHSISKVTWSGGRIDSVGVNKSFVDYDSSTPHIFIFFNGTH